MERRISLMLDIHNIPLNDQNVWEMIGDGRVKGCFQVESYLGKSWCQKIKPKNIEELSDLIAIIRPGVLQFMFDDKSMAQHYADRKNGEAEAIPIHAALSGILSETYQVLLYQEQIIKIAQDIAGFNEAEGDILRKSIGKKDAKLLNSIEEKFVEGCLKVGKVDEDAARLIFSNIRKSSRYLFNKSHSVSYAMLSYWSAYLKYHYPRLFFKHWLRDADEKIDPDLEKKQLILAAKNENIAVYGPHFTVLEPNFCWDVKKDGIRFGLCNVKNVGRLHFEKLSGLLEDKTFTWSELLIRVLPHINKRAIENLIKVGAFSGLRKTRSEMLHEFSCISSLTKKELSYLADNCDINESLETNILNLIKAGVKSEGGAIASSARMTKVEDLLKRIQEPGRSLSDNPALYAKIEEKLLGCSINHSELSGCSDASYANTTCKEINDGKTDSSTIAVVVRRVKEHKTKKKDLMAFLSVEDDTGELENIVVFPDMYEQNKDIIYEEATLLITGSINSDRGSFIVDSIFLI